MKTAMRNNNDTGYEFKRLDLSQNTGMGLRTRGCILLFCEKGYAVASVNFERRPIREGCVVLVFPDTLFSIERIGESGSVLSLEISAAMLDDTTFSLSSPFWDYLSEYPILFPDAAQKELLTLWWRLLRKILSLPSSKHARLLFRNHLCNFFVGMEAEMLPLLQRKHAEQTDTVRLYFNKFCQLVMEHCHTQHDVRFYADRLCITTHYLSKITRKMMDSSPKDLIDRQLVMEIKQLLMTPELSVKEIADRFHFDSVSYLGRYFRRHTGMSPTEFRGQ